MSNICICIECDHKCYEYYNNPASDKAYYEWTYKQDKCDAEYVSVLREKENKL